MSRTIRLAAVAICAISNPVFAQSETERNDRVQGFVSLGPGLVPQYEGADSYRPVPFTIATVRYKDMSLEIQGLRMRADLIRSDLFAAGPVLNLRLPRSAPDDSRVAQLDDIGTALEGGGFVGLRIGGDDKGQGRVAIDLGVVADLTSAHGGFLITAGVGYAAIRNDRFSLSIDTQATYGNDDYVNTYFGITPDEAVRSGLAVYTAEASLRDIGIGATATYQFSSRWGLTARLTYNHLLGDAADSPIVQDEGSRSQGQAAIGISYRF